MARGKEKGFDLLDVMPFVQDMTAQLGEILRRQGLTIDTNSLMLDLQALVQRYGTGSKPPQVTASQVTTASDDYYEEIASVPYNIAADAICVAHTRFERGDKAGAAEMALLAFATPGIFELVAGLDSMNSSAPDAPTEEDLEAVLSADEEAGEECAEDEDEVSASDEYYEEDASEDEEELVECGDDDEDQVEEDADDEEIDQAVEQAVASFEELADEVDESSAGDTFGDTHKNRRGHTNKGKKAKTNHHQHKNHSSVDPEYSILAAARQRLLAKKNPKDAEVVEEVEDRVQANLASLDYEDTDQVARKAARSILARLDTGSKKK